MKTLARARRCGCARSSHLFGLQMVDDGGLSGVIETNDDDPMFAAAAFPVAAGAQAAGAFGQYLLLKSNLHFAWEKESEKQSRFKRRRGKSGEEKKRERYLSLLIHLLWLLLLVMRATRRNSSRYRMISPRWPLNTVHTLQR